MIKVVQYRPPVFTDSGTITVEVGNPSEFLTIPFVQAFLTQPNHHRFSVSVGCPTLPYTDPARLYLVQEADEGREWWVVARLENVTIEELLKTYPAFVPKEYPWVNPVWTDDTGPLSWKHYVGRADRGRWRVYTPNEKRKVYEEAMRQVPKPVEVLNTATSKVDKELDAFKDGNYLYGSKDFKVKGKDSEPGYKLVVSWRIYHRYAINLLKVLLDDAHKDIARLEKLLDRDDIAELESLNECGIEVVRMNEPTATTELKDIYQPGDVLVFNEQYEWGTTYPTLVMTKTFDVQKWVNERAYAKPGMTRKELMHLTWQNLLLCELAVKAPVRNMRLVMDSDTIVARGHKLFDQLD